MSKWTPEEQREHRKEWIKALRSGEFLQGKKYLNKDNLYYCCLGVACELMARKEILQKEVSKYEDNIEITYNNGLYISPEEAVVYYGLKYSQGSYKINGVVNSLIGDNDQYMKSFDEIADIIENEPEGLLA